MTFIEPMLAETFPKVGSLDKYGDDYYAEEKMDGERRGIRVTENGVLSWSRLANAHPLPPHLAEAAQRLPVSYLDAEIQVPGGKSWDVKRSENRDRLVLVLFDIMEVLGHSVCALPQVKRNEYLDTATERVGTDIVTKDGLPAIVIAKRYSGSEPTFFQALYDTVVNNGGEGLMLKKRSGIYRPGMRSESWLKLKQVIEVNLECLGFDEGTTKGLLSVAKLRLPNGQPTTVKSRTMADAQAWTRDSQAFIGRMMEVEAQCWTPDGSLRHPRMVRWAGGHE